MLQQLSTSHKTGSIGGTTAPTSFQPVLAIMQEGFKTVTATNSARTTDNHAENAQSTLLAGSQRSTSETKFELETFRPTQASRQRPGQ